MKANEFINEKWSQKYKRSINCAHPKGFSQRAHCQGRKKNEDIEVDEARKGSWNLPDERTETMSLKDLQQHIGLPKMKLIGRNPEFIDNFHTAQSIGVAVGGRFSRRNGFETVDIAHGPMGDSKLRRMVSFHFGLSGRRIAQAVVYNNWNDERHSQGGIKWSYVKTVEHPLDRRENQRLAKSDEVDEMALAKYQTVGDFDKPGPFRGADKKLIPHPANQLKAQQFFEKTPYDFRLFFSNVPGTGRYSEYGVMGPNEVRNNFGKELADQLIDGSEETITVLFVGNKGDSKKMMTPWIMAHRIGHAVQAGVRRDGGGTWREAENHFFRGINQLLADYYGVSAKNVYDNQVNWQLRQQYAALFNAIGTQRSSRTGQIKRPYEFLYELFAQYIGTGQITLNPLPKRQDYGRKAWGRSAQSLRMTGDAGREAEYTTEVLARDMEIMFSDVLSSLVGKILIM